LDVVAVEYFVASSAILLIPLRERLPICAQMIGENEFSPNYGRVIPFVVIVAFMPELVAMMDVELLSAFI